MKTQHIQLNIPLSFWQVVDIVRQLPPNEKQQLGNVLRADELNFDNTFIPDEQKQIVCERIKKQKNNSYLSWKDIEHKMAARK
jgi:3-hydroxymyristoyl/3-hydroxydecanoyl-(acyl carrier protein) dehydratase